MATLDQLPAEQRAIVELVVQRGRSYDSLADVLQVPESRVRELARDALVELSPRTAARVDEDWRGRVADYLLKQQESGDARETRSYLKRSESARAWALSLLDSLDPLYGADGAPPVPEAPDEDDEAEAEETPKKAAAAAASSKPTAEERVRARERERKPERERVRKPKDEPERARRPHDEDDDEKERDDRDDRERGRDRDRDRDRAKRRDGLSPAAQSALKRRRLIGGAVAALVLIGLVVGILALAGVFSGDDKGSKNARGGATTTASNDQELKVLGQIALNPVDKTRAQGIAYLVEQAGKRYVVVQAQVPPLPGNQKVAAYEVWLYNSKGDARSLGAQYTDEKGILQGRAPLPNDFARFKAIDVSRELFSDRNAGHGNSSVLRGTFESIQEVPQEGQSGAPGAEGGAGGAQGGAGAAPGGAGAAPGGAGAAPGGGTAP